VVEPGHVKGAAWRSRLWNGYMRGRNWFSNAEFLGTFNLLFNRF
jgi:hypothetical protein